jgi:hypothetical protein
MAQVAAQAATSNPYEERRFMFCSFGGDTKRAAEQLWIQPGQAQNAL